MKFASKVLFGLSLFFISVTGVGALDDDYDFSSQTLDSVKEKLNEKDVKIFTTNSVDYSFKKEKNLDFNNFSVSQLKKSDAIVIDADDFDGFVEKNLLDSLKESLENFSLFFTGDYDFTDVYDLIGTTQGEPDNVYMVGYICIDSDCYTVIYKDADVSKDRIEEKILEEIYVSIFDQKFYPEKTSPSHDNSVSAFNTSNQWVMDNGYWYIMTDWYAVDVSADGSTIHYGDYREWTQVLMIYDLQTNQKEYIAVNKKGHMVPDNPGTTNDMRSEFFNPYTDIDQYYSDLKLFDWMPQLNPTTHTVNISYGSTVSSEGSESEIGVSYQIVVGQLDILFNGMNSIGDYFNVYYEWTSPTINNLAYNEEETVNCWGYLVQVDSTTNYNDLRFWTERTHFQFLRDLFWKNYHVDETLLNQIFVYMPQRDAYGVIED